MRPAQLLVRNVGTLVSPAGTGAQRGAAFGTLDVRRDVEIAVVDGEIGHVGAAGSWRHGAERTLDARGRAVVPALVDPHTHVIWGGDRLDDFEATLRGDGYEAILARGGGIRHTVRETARRDETELVDAARARLDAMVQGGAATIEVKSGYGGTDFDVERRQLRAVRRLEAMHRATLVPTMLFHLPPADRASRADWLDHACHTFIPSLAAESLAVDIDVFVEREAFTVAEARELVTAAARHGLGAHLHADQFAAMGGVELGVALGVRSVDHLEASGPTQVAALAASDTVAVALPGVTLHLGLPPAPVRALAAAGAIVAIGTDCNPGSSPLYSMQLAMALAVRLYRLTPAEALAAATVNAAAALGLARTGRVTEGATANFLVLDSDDWRDLACALGGAPIARTVTRSAVTAA